MSTLPTEIDLAASSDAEVMQAFVEEIRLLSDLEAADEVGLSHEAVRRYRNGEWKRLQKATRRKIEGYLRSRSTQSGVAERRRVYIDAGVPRVSDVFTAFEQIAAIVDEARGVAPGREVPRPSRSGNPEEIVAQPDSSTGHPSTVALLETLLDAHRDLDDRIQVAFEEADLDAWWRRKRGEMDDVEWRAWRTVCRGAVLAGGYDPVIDQGSDPVAGDV